MSFEVVNFVIVLGSIIDVLVIRVRRCGGVLFVLDVNV